MPIQKEMYFITLKKMDKGEVNRFRVQAIGVGSVRLWFWNQEDKSCAPGVNSSLGVQVMQCFPGSWKNTVVT